MTLKRGTQVIYSPPHAKFLHHPDCEVGFVTEVKAGWAFVRYFYHGGILRTTANSERTPIDALTVRDTYPQGKIDAWLRALGYTCDD